MLVPVGIINERHEPPVFHGVERPFVDTVIVPTTWFEAGAGVHGSLRSRFPVPRLRDGAARRHGVLAPRKGCEAARSTAARRVVRNVALTGRLEYVGIRGLQTGVSFWRGDTGFNVPTH